MSAGNRGQSIGQSAQVFAALGDRTRLDLLAKLGAGKPASIARLTRGSSLTRQAITKHLRVLQRAGLVRGIRQGRECVFELQMKRMRDAQRALEGISRQWDAALARLKAFVDG
jgi:DNA-binding transcriptional ArsR family regulator